MRLSGCTVLDEITHGDAERLGAPDLRVRFQLCEGARGKLHGSVRAYLPMRHEQCPRARIEERARHAGQSFRGFTTATCGVAGRKDHPVGIELEGRDLGCGEETVVTFQV